jgi:hypothetical protein
LEFDSFIENYLQDVWNILDLLRILFSIGYLVCAFTPGETPDAESELYGFIMLFSWVCLIQYLRIITEFRYLATLIVKCFAASMSFLTIQFILMFGFSLAFYWRNIKYYDEDHGDWWSRFIGIYYITFGDFQETDLYKTGFDWTYFLLANIIICIVMMNLLIGILSEKLVEILEIKDQFLYKELLDLIITLETY